MLCKQFQLASENLLKVITSELCGNPSIILL